jgi:membrane-bound serine protease (ClpP class)
MSAKTLIPVLLFTFLLSSIFSVPNVCFGEDQEKVGLAAVVTVSGFIDEFEAKAFQVRLENSLAKKPSHVIVKIDSASGLAISVEKIVKQIQNLNDEGIQTTAFIDGDAVSVAAMIAVACQKIVMSPESRIGAAVPAEESFGDKQQESRLRDGQEDRSDDRRRLDTWKFSFETFASQHNFDELIIQGMLENRYGLMRLTTPATNKAGRVLFMSKREYEGLLEDDRARFTTRTVLAEPGIPLILDAETAKEAGINSATPLKTVDDVGAELAKRDELPSVEVFELRNLWWLEILALVHKPWVKVFLFAMGTICLFIAFGNPGTGAAEVLTVLAFGLVFGSSYFVGFASYIEIIIFLLGVGLLAMEILVIPGFGVTGVLGVLCLLMSFLLALQSFFLPTTNAEWTIFSMNLVRTLISFSLTALIIGALLRIFGKTTLFHKLILDPKVSSLTPVVAGTKSAAETLIGRHGIVHSTLRPSGEIRVGDDVIDALSEGRFLETGTAVEIVGRRGFSLLVRPVPKSLTYDVNGPASIKPIPDEPSSQNERFLAEQ